MGHTDTTTTARSTHDSSSLRYWRWGDPHVQPERAGAERTEMNRISAVHIDDVESDRMIRIEEIRAEIAGGSYDTDHKIEVALDRMIDALGAPEAAGRSG